jgi:hypothetical protein
MEEKMRKLVLTTMGLLLALPSLLAEDAPKEVAQSPAPTYRTVTRQVNDLLRYNKEKVQLDQEQLGDSKHLRREMNKIYYHTNPRDNSLVKIEIEAIGEESTGTAVLAATFLSALSAVPSVDEAARLANLLSIEHAKDGLPRSIPFSNGMKLMKIKTESSVAKFVIVL